MEPALAVANAVLYEGYILFPYTASAKKNRIRWQFGVIVPEAYAANGTGEPADRPNGDPARMPGAKRRSIVQVRFLQVETRWVQVPARSAHSKPVESLEVDGQRHVTFDEGVEREVNVANLTRRRFRP